MGLQAGVLPAAWAVTYGSIFLVVSVSVTTVCCASFLPLSSPTLVFTLLALFCAAELALGMMMATLFSNAKIAGIVAPLVHFACLLPRYIHFKSSCLCNTSQEDD